jgi:hypothetical protein
VTVVIGRKARRGSRRFGKNLAALAQAFSSKDCAIVINQL